VLINAHFDESSEGDTKNGLLAVCGYALDDAGIKRLIPAWKRMLDKYDLPFFRMSDCNSGKGVFSHLDPADCDKCARKAIKLARKYTLHGHAYVLDQTEYRQILEDNGFDCDPYSFLVWSSFLHVNKWVLNNRPNHKIALFFEAGYKTQKRAKDLMAASLNDKFNLVSRTDFVKKEDSEPTQAGDLVAWHIRRGYEHMRTKKSFKKDTLALIENKSIKTIHFNAEGLRKIRGDFEKKAGSLANATELIFSKVGAGVVGR
jgi:hypothetical protein